LDSWAGHNNGTAGDVAPQIDNKLGVFYRTQDGFARPSQGRGNMDAGALLWGSQTSSNNGNVFAKTPVMTTAEAQRWKEFNSYELRDFR